MSSDSYEVSAQVLKELLEDFRIKFLVKFPKQLKGKITNAFLGYVPWNSRMKFRKNHRCRLWKKCSRVTSTRFPNRTSGKDHERTTGRIIGGTFATTSGGTPG